MHFHIYYSGSYHILDDFQVCCEPHFPELRNRRGHCRTIDMLISLVAHLPLVLQTTLSQPLVPSTTTPCPNPSIFPAKVQSLTNETLISGCRHSRPRYQNTGPIDLNLRDVHGAIIGRATFVHEPGEYEFRIASNLYYIHTLSIIQEWSPPGGGRRHNITLINNHPVLINKAIVWFYVEWAGYIFYEFKYFQSDPRNSRMRGKWELHPI